VIEPLVRIFEPLAKDAAWAQSLDLNAAARFTDYSTSGFVTTWKAGAVYTPIDDLTFRVTRSRDIRSPNLGELFNAGRSGTGTGAMSDTSARTRPGSNTGTSAGTGTTGTSGSGGTNPRP
jgi:outer membrane cobalamin receptor